MIRRPGDADSPHTRDSEGGPPAGRITRPIISLLGIMCLALLLVPQITAQVSSTDLSYYPLHVGNIWVYQVSEFYPNPPNWRPVDTLTQEIIGDTVLGNGHRYAMFDTGLMVRVDSTTGRVYEPIPSGLGGSNCPDSTEREIFNLTIDTAAWYSRCQSGWYDTCRIVPLSSERVGQLNLSRPQRIWEDWLITYRIAEGIGMCFVGGPGLVNKQRELIYARINGKEYFPVELRVFTASLLTGHTVRLRWETANEVQNRGFTVQRYGEESRDAMWTDLAFIPSNAEEGRGGSYEYIDHVVKTDHATSAVRYRLRQQDYDGTVSYSPVQEVQFSPPTGPPDLELYPNPVAAGELVSAQLGGDLRDDVTRELQVFDALGHRIVTQFLDRSTILNTAGLPAGLYFVRVRGEPQAEPEHLIVF